MSLESFLESLPEWKDEDRIRSLFGSFSKPRYVNPEAYDSRMEFWRKIIINSCRQQLFGNSVFRVPAANELSLLFSKHGSHPLGLTRVMKDLVAEGKASLDTAFMGNNSLEESLLTKFARLVITAPLTLGWNWISGKGYDDDEDDERFNNQDHTIEPNFGPLVLDILLKEVADDVVKLFNSSRNKNCLISAISWSEFVDLIQETRQNAKLPPIKDEDDFILIFKYLGRKNLVAIYEQEESDLQKLILRIKLLNEGKAPPISSEEANIIKMRAICRSLEFQLQRLETQIQLARQSTLDALKNQDRPLALIQLKNRKLLETTRNQRLQSLSTINEILIKIDNAQTDAQVYSAYKIGEQTLRGIISSTGITVESVDDLVLALQEAFDEQTQISTALSQGPSTLEGVEDLESELADLIQGEEKAEQAPTELPNVPDLCKQEPLHNQQVDELTSQLNKGLVLETE